MVLSLHLYADDTQIHGSCLPAVETFLSKINECVNDVADWMRSNRLQLMADKTDFISSRQQRLPTAGPTFSYVSITPASSICDLGIFIDSDLAIRIHVQRSFTLLLCITSSAWYPALGISHSFESLVVALVLSQSVLTGLPAT